MSEFIDIEEGEFTEETEFPPEGYEEEWVSIWGKVGREVKVEKDEERSVLFAKISAVFADTIERPEWDIVPAPLPANWAQLGPLPEDIPWNP